MLRKLTEHCYEYQRKRCPYTIATFQLLVFSKTSLNDPCNKEDELLTLLLTLLSLYAFMLLFHKIQNSNNIVEK